MKTICRIASTRARTLGTVLVIASFIAFAGRLMTGQTTPPWEAPEDAKTAKNPVPSTRDNLEDGQTLYRENCTICHGDKGHGDGFGIKMLTAKPADLTDPKRMAQETDGEYFWKISNGRWPMPAWKDTLTETQRWTLVNYLRQLGTETSNTPQPQ